MRLIAACGLLLACCGDAAAQVITDATVPGAGHGSASVVFQQITIRERKILGFYEDFGKITLRSAYLEFDYGITDRLAVTATIPFKSNRYEGDFPHDPRTLINPRGERFLDDGQYHSNWGDWGLGFRWLWRTEPFLVTPFIGFYYPSHDYPLFTETQAGTGQWRLSFGVNAAGRFKGRARNLLWNVSYAYNRMEKTFVEGEVDRHVDHSLLAAELVWLISPEWFVNGVLSYKKTHNGFRFPEDFNPPFVDDLFFVHDQLLQWGGLNGSVGIGRRIGDRYTVMASYGESLTVDFGHRYDPVITVGLSRGF